MKKFTQITDAICRYISYISMAALVFMMGYMFLDLLMRHIFNKPFTGGYEITSLVLSVLIFMSWSYTQTQHGHIHVTMLVGIMPKIPRFICFGVTSILSAVVMGIATYAAFIQMLTMKASNVSTGMLLIPHWPFLCIQGIALAMFTVILIRDAIKAVLALFIPAYAEEVQEYWT